MKKLYTFTKLYIPIIIALLVIQFVEAQFKIPEIPKEQTSVYDYAKLLTANQKTALEQKLIRYSDSTSTQIVVLIVESINGENIDILNANWAHSWGIGQAKEDNGVSILLAHGDRKISIQTGYGVEHLLTDALAKRIIENVIIPEFKKGDYYKGLDRGADVIFDVLSGEYQNNQPKSNGKSGIPRVFLIIFIVIIILIIFSKKDRGGGSGGRRDSSGSILDAIILSRMGRGGFGNSGGFGGSSGGGFGGGGFGGGFGGGGFGGGGASGGW